MMMMMVKMPSDINTDEEYDDVDDDEDAKISTLGERAIIEPFDTNMDS